MAVPTYQLLMRPALDVLADRGVTRFGDLVEAIADLVGLSEEDRAERISSGQRVIQNRAGWAVTYLVQAGAVRRPRRGFAEITDRGRALLSQGYERITNDELAQFPEFGEFKARAGTASGSTAREASEAVAIVTESSGTPVEQIEQAAKVANAAVVSELLARVHAQPPEFLERLVLRLLVAMGYGDKLDGAADHRGRSGDEGIDGVIRQDPLGLDLVYLQAKRYAPEVTVGRPDIQAFVGALHGAQASRGVFITTSKFSSGARDYAERVHNARVILIDGRELAALMLRHGIGVQPDLVVTLYKIDEDFFDAS